MVHISSAPGSAWKSEAAREYLGFAAANPFVLLGRLTAPQAEPVPLLGQQDWGERLVVHGLEWEAAGATDGGKESEGEWRMTKKETQTKYFLLSVYYLLLRLAKLSFQFRQCLAPFIQPKVKLVSRKRSCTPSVAHWGNGEDEDWRCAFHSRFLLERSGNLSLRLSSFWLRSQELLSRSFKPIHCQLFRVWG